MKLNAFGVDLYFSFWFFASLTVFTAVGRGTLALYLLLPIAIHECGHVLAMALCGIKVEAVSFRAFGVEIRKGSVSVPYGKDIAVCLGGVVANILMALGFYLFAFKSVRAMLFIAVNLAVALFNAMPVATLDGGQALRLLLERFGDTKAAFTVSRIFSLFLLIPLFAGASYLMLRGFANVSLMAACLYLAGVVVFNE